MKNLAKLTWIRDKISCASRNSTSPASQIVTRNLQNAPQKPPKWRPKPFKIEPKLNQEGSRTTKKSKNNIDPTKRGAASHRVAPFSRKMWPTWLQLRSQDGAKMKKKTMQKSIKTLMHLGIDFWKDFRRFWEPEWSHVGTQIVKKSMPIAKSDFFLNHGFSSGKATIF